MPGVVVEVLPEAGEDSATVVVEEGVGAAELEAADLVLAGAAVEDEVEILISLSRAVSEGVGHRPHIGRSGALPGKAGCDYCTKESSYTVLAKSCKVK